MKSRFASGSKKGEWWRMVSWRMVWRMVRNHSSVLLYAEASHRTVLVLREPAVNNLLDNYFSVRHSLSVRIGAGPAVPGAGKTVCRRNS